jgi:hypothetical protein
MAVRREAFRHGMRVIRIQSLMTLVIDYSH